MTTVYAVDLYVVGYKVEEGIAERRVMWNSTNSGAGTVTRHD